MEHLLFLLFVLFSVGSALLERRKRKLARSREEEAARRGERVEVSEDEEEAWIPTTDPFELEPPPERISTAELERQALEAAQRTQEAEVRARELERQAGEQRPQRRVEELVQEVLQQKRMKPAARRKKGWSISAEKARQGIIYAEILGKPKATRRDGS
jgi:hypothetical protein